MSDMGCVIIKDLILIKKAEMCFGEDNVVVMFCGVSVEISDFR